MDLIIETHNLTKQYCGQGGCQEICLSVAEGQIFGLLGPNGAGKSTLVKTLLGLLRPTSGQAWLLGRPLGDLAVRRRLGFLPENFRYQDWLTGQELLAFHGSLAGMSRAEQEKRAPMVLEMVGMTQAASKRIGAYSKGMQQRIGLACALLPDPDLIFLDEPTSALDPLGRREVREIITSLRRQGKTVFLNSHLLSEVEMICDQIAVIKNGRVVAGGSLAELTGGAVEVQARVSGLTAETADRLAAIGRMTQPEEGLVRIMVDNPDDVPRLARVLISGGAELYELTQKHRSLEDVFIDLVREEGGVGC